jgi:AcrR family transcriptional regulator
MLGNRNTDSEAGRDAVEVGGTRVDRRAARREATKAEILEAAWELVREHGLAALSLRDLAERVGMRAPSLYQYFDSKNAIYDAMFKQGMVAALEAMDGVGSGGDTRAELIEGARRMVEFAVNDPARAQLLFQRTIPGFEPSPESYAPSLDLNARMQAALQAHDIDDPEALDLFTALVSGIINQQLANDPDGDRWVRLVDRIVDMFIAQVAPAARRPKKKGTK